MERLDSTAAVACSLNDADFRARQSYARQRLIPRITRTQKIANGLLVWFDGRTDLENDLNTFIDLERQCCGFLTFTITRNLSDDAGAVCLKIEGPAQAAATLEMFVRAARTAAS